MAPQATNKNERQKWSGSHEKTIQGPRPEKGDLVDVFNEVTDETERNKFRPEEETHEAPATQAEPYKDSKTNHEAMEKRLDQLRQDLEHLILSKTAQVQQELQVNEESQIDYNHPADSMEGGEGRERHLNLVHHAQEELRQVLDAINRLHTHTFGICQSCGDPIHAERLNAIPYTRMCIDCQIEEVEEKRRCT